MLNAKAECQEGGPAMLKQRQFLRIVTLMLAVNCLTCCLLEIVVFRVAGSVYGTQTAHLCIVTNTDLGQNFGIYLDADNGWISDKSGAGLAFESTSIGPTTFNCITTAWFPDRPLNIIFWCAWTRSVNGCWLETG